MRERSVGRALNTVEVRTERPALRRALVRTAGAESNVVQSVEYDRMNESTGGVMRFWRGADLVYAVSVYRLVDIRPETGGEA